MPKSSTTTTTRQVLTIDLLDKGYRYTEVPITYRFRSSGRSFVKVGTYLSHVVPAVYRELNNPTVSVLDDVTGESVTGTRPPSIVEAPVGVERAGRGPTHGQDVMRVVLDEQPLAAEDEQPILR